MDADRSIPHVVAAAAAALMLFAPTPSALAAGDAAPALRVSYADLDLSTPEGITALYVRVRDAARRVCEPLRLRTGTLVTDRYDACVRAAIGATGRRLGMPALMALYAGERRVAPLGGLRRADGQRAWVLM